MTHASRERSVAAALAAWALVGVAVVVGWIFRLRKAPTEPIWDGWRYQVAAEAIARGELLTWNHVGFSLLAVPLLPWWGERAAWALSMLGGLAGIVLAFVLVRRAVGVVGGVAAAFLLALTPVHAYWSGTGHSGTVALALALAAAWCVYAGRGWWSAGLVLAGATVRPDFVLLAPLLIAIPFVDARAPRAAARPLALALPLFLVVGVAFLAAHGGVPGRVAWDVPDAHAPADWEARARHRPDGTLGLGPAGPTWSVGYAPANLAFYADVLVDWRVHDWSGWVLYLPPNHLVTGLGAVGVALAPRRFGVPLAATASPLLGTYSLYYGFSPEYLFPLLVPLLLAAGHATDAASAIVPERASTRPVRERRGPTIMVLDRIRNAITSTRKGRAEESAREQGPRAVLAVVVHDAAAEPPPDAVPANGGVRGPVAGGGADALERVVSGRESGTGPDLFDVLRENDVPLVAVNAPHGRARGTSRGPGIEAPAAEQALAAVEAAEGRDWRALAVFVNVRESDGPGAWETVTDALARVRESAGDAFVVTAVLERGSGRGDLAIEGPDVPEPAGPLASVAWVDVAPTLYRALGVNVPEEIDGFPVEEAFAEAQWSEEDERRVAEHLEKLGYL